LACESMFVFAFGVVSPSVFMLSTASR